MANAYRCVLAGGGSGGVIPDGKTVTPTDNIQILLNCGGIFDKDYTTLTELLNDPYCAVIIFSLQNSIDYLVRSVTWVNDVTNDNLSMIIIGKNDYSALTLLSNNTWKNAILNSAYFALVLTEVVPTMTSNTTPKGTAFASSQYSDSYSAYKAFNGSKSQSKSWWSTASNKISNEYIGYQFDKKVKIFAIEITNIGDTSKNIENFNVQYKDGAGNWVTNTSSSFVNPNTATATTRYTISPDTDSDSWRLFILDNHGNSSEINVVEIQFYGRAVSAS